jgi:putative ABC transport system permease protein
MFRLQSIVAGVRALFRKKQVEREMDEELRGYLDAAVKDKMRSGMSQEQALRAARVEMGSVEAVKEEIRTAGWEAHVESLWQDLRHSMRALAKNPGFTVLAILTLALGIGANTAIFSVVYAVLIRPLPFKDPGRLVMVWETWEKRGDQRVVVSAANFADWKEQSKTLDHMAAMWWYGQTVRTNGEPFDISDVRVTSDFFDALGVRPARGRAFSPEEQRYSGFRVVILSDSLWRKLGGDPALIGKTVQLDGQPCRVVGIMPPGFNFPSEDDAWLPLPQNEVVKGRRGDHYLRVIAKLKPGVSLAQAQTEMDTIAARLRQAYPQENGSIGVGVNVVSLEEQTVGEIRRALLVLLAAVTCLLLIACTNVANLMLARATARQREFALRLTLGAGRWRMIRYVLAESTMLAVAGGALGVAWAYLGVQAFVALDPIKLPRIQEIAVNASMLLFTLLVAISTGMLCGLAPALRSSRLDLNETLKEGSERKGGRPSRTRASSALAIVQVALSMVLLTSAGLLLRSFIQRVTVPLGFRPDGVLAVELPWFINSQIDGLLERLRTLPGVQAAGAAASFPNDSPNTSAPIEVEGLPATRGEELDAGKTPVTPDYFRAAGMTLRKGRFIASSDTATAPRVAVINEALAHRCFQGKDPIGRHIRFWGGPWFTVVGIVGDVKGFGVAGDSMPNVYFSRQQDSWGNPVYVLIRTAVRPSSLVPAVRKEIISWNKNIVIGKLVPIGDLLAESVTVPRFYMLMVLASAALAIALAAVGVYGLLNYSVADRTHEIGVRMALGAERGDVLEMILKQGLTLILAGIVLGLAGAWAATRALQSMLFQVHARDAATFACACVVLIAVGLLACYLPARRATKVDPMVALRHE